MSPVASVPGPSNNQPIRIAIFGTASLLKKMKTIEGFSKSPRFRAALEDAGHAYQILARQSAPKASRTLASSIGYQIKDFGTPNVQIIIGFDNRSSRWARHVEFGSGPSSRVPRVKKYMHWFSDGPGGRTIQEPYGMKGQGGYTSNFRKWVMHPGTKPQPFFLQHLPKIRDKLIRALTFILKDEIEIQRDTTTPS